MSDNRNISDSEGVSADADDKERLSNPANENNKNMEKMENATVEAMRAIEEANSTLENVTLNVDNICAQMEELKQIANTKAIGKDEMEKLSRFAEEATQDAKTAVSNLADKINNWNKIFQEFAEDASSRLDKIKDEIQCIATEKEKSFQEVNKNKEADFAVPKDEAIISVAGNDGKNNINERLDNSSNSHTDINCCDINERLDISSNSHTDMNCCERCCM